MNVDGTKITWVSLDEIIDQRHRPGFISVHMYGPSVSMERNEVGAIVKQTGEPIKLHRPSGVFAIPCRYIERIFVVEPA